MFLGHWLTLCCCVFARHSTSNSKKLAVHSYFYFCCCLHYHWLLPPSPTLPSMLRNPLTSPSQTCMFVYIQAPISLLWCSCSLILPQCMHWMLYRKHTGDSHSIDSLKSDFTGAVWISGAKDLQPRLCVTLSFYMRKHRLAVLLCILLKKLRR